MREGRIRLALAMLACIGIVMGVDARSAAAQPERVAVGYIYPQQRSLTLSLVDRPTDDRGLAGAELAIADNNTTGRFTGQAFELVPQPVADDAAAVEAVAALAEDGVGLVAVDLPREGLAAVAEAAAPHGMLVFNLGARDDALRVDQCLDGVVHIVPSRAMLADALAQYLAWKKWNRWFLVAGSHPEDAAFAEALKRAAQRFGARIVEERTYEDTGGARTTDSGHVQVQRRLPVFLQDAAEHDVIVVADESEVFGTYVPYHSWDPRPVVGSAGMMPTAWSPVHEQWGAVQLQNRFREDAGRFMQAEDMLAWMAVRAIGEAATRAATADPQAIREYILGPDFQLAAFKGEALSLRPWSRQLRQPILLADNKQVVSVSPQEGFLHPTSFLDTLGYDRPESRCGF